MVITWTFVLLLLLVVSPGLVFLRFYFRRDFHRRYGSSTPILKLFGIALIPGSINLVLYINLVGFFGFTFNYQTLVDEYKNLIDPKQRFEDSTESNDTSDTESDSSIYVENLVDSVERAQESTTNLANNSEDHSSDDLQQTNHSEKKKRPWTDTVQFVLLQMVFLVHLNAFFWASLAIEIVEGTNLDKKSTIFRSTNLWHNLFTGIALPYSRMNKMNNIPSGESTIAQADIMVSDQNVLTIYSGYIYDYEVSDTDISQLQTVILAGARRSNLRYDNVEVASKALANKRQVFKPIIGKLLVIEWDRVVNINLLYLDVPIHDQYPVEKRHSYFTYFWLTQLIRLAFIMIAVAVGYFRPDVIPEFSSGELPVIVIILWGAGILQLTESASFLKWIPGIKDSKPYVFRKPGEIFKRIAYALVILVIAWGVNHWF